MAISPLQLYNLLKGKGVTHIYHANSLLTSCLFLQNKNLLSRENVSKRGLYQTPQYTDEIDKKVGVWNDIFMDTIDIHKRIKNANKYGPVTFRFSIELLKDYQGEILITKLNPAYWQGIEDNKRYFQNIEDLNNNLTIGDFGQMIILRNNDGTIPLSPHLSSIIVDNPKQKVNLHVTDMFSQSVGALKLAKHIGQVEVDLKIRKCNTFCQCSNEYLNVKILNKMFSLESL